MAANTVRVWLDSEGDFLEVIFDPSRAGYFRETADDRVMEKVDEDGRVLGFSILGLRSLRAEQPIDVVLHAREP